MLRPHTQKVRLDEKIVSGARFRTKFSETISCLRANPVAVGVKLFGFNEMEASEQIH